MSFKQILLLIIVVISFAVLVPMRGVSAALDCDTNGDGVVSNSESIACGATQANGGTGTSTSIDSVIRKGINILSALVGVVAVIMIVIGGFRYITSGGVSEKVTSAKNTILYAVIGLIIVALAQVIVRFTLAKTIDNSCVGGKTSSGQSC